MSTKFLKNTQYLAIQGINIKKLQIVIFAIPTKMMSKYIQQVSDNIH